MLKKLADSEPLDSWLTMEEGNEVWTLVAAVSKLAVVLVMTVEPSHCC